VILPNWVDRLKSLLWRGFFWANVECHCWISPFGYPLGCFEQDKTSKTPWQAFRIRKTLPNIPGFEFAIVWVLHFLCLARDALRVARMGVGNHLDCRHSRPAFISWFEEL
jgi:hypothetical protein